MDESAISAPSRELSCCRRVQDLSTHPGSLTVDQPVFAERVARLCNLLNRTQDNFLDVIDISCVQDSLSHHTDHNTFGTCWTETEPPNSNDILEPHASHTSGGEMIWEKNTIRTHSTAKGQVRFWSSSSWHSHCAKRGVNGAPMRIINWAWRNTVSSQSERNDFVNPSQPNCKVFFPLFLAATRTEKETSNRNQQRNNPGNQPTPQRYSDHEHQQHYLVDFTSYDARR